MRPRESPAHDAFHDEVIGRASRSPAGSEVELPLRREIDVDGRKKLLLTGAVGTTLCLAGVSYVFLSHSHENWLVWLLVAYIAFFAFSQGAVIWVYIGEVFPNRVRAAGQSLGSFTHWVMAGIISLGFPAVAAKSGVYPFVFFSAMMALQFFVVLLWYPETKGITLEEMQKKLGIA